MKRLLKNDVAYGLTIVFCIFLAFFCVSCDELLEQLDLEKAVSSGEYGCGKPMLEVPKNPGELGPWPVSYRYEMAVNPNVPERNMYHGKEFRVMIYYPAKPGSEAGKEKHVLDVPDILYYLPDVDTTNVEVPYLPTDYYDDLPLDTEHGPYPVIIYVHGTTSSSMSHYKMCAHWASRGFVVIAADYNGIQMGHMLKNFSTFAQHKEELDTKYLLETLRAESGPFAFLKGHIDTGRIGMSGHSWGGKVVGESAGEPGVQVIIPMASTGVNPSPTVKSAMIMGAMDDYVLGWETLTYPAYKATSQPKRLLGLPNAGHMIFSDMCTVVALAPSANVELDPMIEHMATDGCNIFGETRFFDQDLAMDIIRYASAGVFEETLQCSPTAGEMVDNIKNEYSDIKDLVYESKPEGGSERAMPIWGIETMRLTGKMFTGRP